MTQVDNSGHERWRDDAAAYALHALDEAEVGPFEKHLASCPQCQEELAELRWAVERLPDAAPVAHPPEDLGRRVMATVRAEAALRASAGPGIPPRRAGWPSWWSTQMVMGAAAAAAVVVAVLVVALSGGGATHPARTYAGVVAAPGATVALIRSDQRGQLRYRDLPAPPPGRIYQVWLRRGQQPPQPTPTLFASRTGSVSVAGSLRGVTAVLVTAEPRPNGSRVPTRTPIIVVRLT